MKHLVYVALLLVLNACSNPEAKKNENIINNTQREIINNTSKLNFIHLDKLVLTGDFDGDGKIDTLTQKIISKLTNLSIDSIPGKLEWDGRSRFFDSVQSDLVLTSQDLKCDTLHFLNAGGLYCLINIGDNNLDGKDEIALVVEYGDFSSVNTCNIYTLCFNKFVELTTFNINERAFDYYGDTIPRFTEIRGSLEKRKGKWFFIDYYKWFNALEAKDTVLRPLKLKKGC